MSPDSSIRVRQSLAYALEIQRRALKGLVVPASFQRPYVWSEREIEALWESILLGLPIGSILLWRPPGGAAGDRTLGPVRVAAADGASYVLDGQNRLATLVWSATPWRCSVAEDSAGLDVWRSGRRLVADATYRRVRFVPNEDDDPWNVAMDVVGDSLSATLRRIWDGSPELQNRAEWLEHLESQLRQAMLVETTLDGDEAAARRAYLLMSAAGVPMSPADFDEAVKAAAHA